MAKDTKRFWEVKTLEELTAQEWELLCDGCGCCCLHKLEDVQSGRVYYTSVACRLLDSYTCRCTCYEKRLFIIPDCLVLDPDSVREYSWLPKTCAYRRLAERKELKWWHPLLSGSTETVHEVGISVRNKIISERYVNLNHLKAYVIGADI